MAALGRAEGTKEARCKARPQTRRTRRDTAGQHTKQALGQEENHGERVVLLSDYFIPGTREFII